MNERIQELVLQADELDYQTFDSYNQTVVQHYKFNKEKFAELIVKECARVAFESDLTMAIGQWGADSAILKHFGVEE